MLLDIVMPTKTEMENLEDFFSYIYEYNKSYVSNAKLEDVKKYLEDEYIKITEKHPDLSGLSNIKKWLLYHFLYMKGQMEKDDFTYAKKSMDTILSSFSQLEDEEISYYINMYYNALEYTGKETLITRPRELHRLINYEEKDTISSFCVLSFAIDDMASVLEKGLPYGKIKKVTKTEILKSNNIEKISLYQILSEYLIAFCQVNTSLKDDDYYNKERNYLDIELETEMADIIFKYLKYISRITISEKKELAGELAAITTATLEDFKEKIS